MENEMISARQETVLAYLREHNIPFTCYNHPEGKTIEEAKRWWKDDGSVHCKNLFFRNHKGNRHYLVSMECHKDLDIHGLEHMVRQGKLSFASEERMMRCLGLHPGSVSAFGLINDIKPDNPNPKELFDDGHRVKYFIDSDLRNVPKISFHPCENTASVVVSHDGFMKFLELWGGQVEWLDMSPGI